MEASKQRKLVIAIDIGTTFSGASYCITEKNRERVTRSVTGFPGQRLDEGVKVPSVILYAQDGTIIAAGAEALSPRMIARTKEEGLIKVEWFKLLLHDQTSKDLCLKKQIQLPPQSTAITVFGDYLQYLVGCIRSFVHDSHVNGRDLWKELLPGADFVLTHPNGWAGLEQSRLRQAAYHAGLVNDVRAKELTFVTEGEASFHFCLRHGLSENPKRRSIVCVIDLGGGTIDLSTFAVSTKNSIDEAANAICLPFGSVTVSQRAEAWFERKLGKSAYSKLIPGLVEEFNKSFKHQFDDSLPSYRIRLDRWMQDSVSRSIYEGFLIVPTEIMRGWFDATIEAILDAAASIEKIIHISNVCLVGGFSANEYVYAQLKQQLTERGLAVFRPTSAAGHPSKAAADGAIHFVTECKVRKRIASFTIGTESVITYKKHDPDHAMRNKRMRQNMEGEYVLPGFFETLVKKGTVVTKNQEFRRSFFVCEEDPQKLDSVEDEIEYYSGDETPKWVEDVRGSMGSVCTIKAKTSQIPKRKLHGPDGRLYYRIDYDIIFTFGPSEMFAQIAWEERDGEERRGKVNIVYLENDISSIG